MFFFVRCMRNIVEPFPPERDATVCRSVCFEIGYSPIGFVRCGRAACRVSKILWKIGKETGGKKVRRRGWGKRRKRPLGVPGSVPEGCAGVSVERAF